jgi:lipopolysaccharide transport system permease protein
MVNITKSYEERINQPTSGWRMPKLGEVWQHRRVLYYLSLQQVQVRYKQTVLGVSWAVINPLITMVVFSFVFNRLAKISSHGLPYPIFSFSALVPWTLFSKGVLSSSISVVSQGQLLTKVYLPRLIAPISYLFTGLIDFCLAFAIFLVMMLGYGYFPDVKSLLVPLFVLLALVTALGIGLWLSALHVIFRDIGHLVPFLMQIWLYLSPVAYPSDLVNPKWRLVYGLNPMMTVCDGFRWALLDFQAFNGAAALVSVVMAVVVLVSGLFVFARLENSFPDLI